MFNPLCWKNGHIFTVIDKRVPFCSRCMKTVDELLNGKEPKVEVLKKEDDGPR